MNAATPGVGSEHRAAGVDDVTGAHRLSLLEKLDAAALLHEADVHALGLVRGAEPEPGRVGSHIGLGELADREHRTRELSLTEHVEHVRLVLGAIGATGELVLPPVLENARVMTSGQQIEAERVRAVEEAPELDRAVALDARVRRTTRCVGVDVRIHHIGGEVVAEIEDVVRDTQLRGNPAGVLHIRHAAAPGVGLTTPQLEGDPRDVVSALEEQGGGHRGVDAAAHRDENPGCRHAVALAARSFATASGTTASAMSTSASTDA